jgi:hypothetical protein
MRFSVFLLSLTLLAARSAVAQRWARTSRQDVELGLIGMVNRNTVTGAGPVDARIRAAAGGFLSVPVARGFRFRSEFLVRGTEVGRTEVFLPPCIPEIDCSRTLHSSTWLELPLLLEARLPRARYAGFRPTVFAGPFLAVRLGCSESTGPGLDPVPLQSSGAKLVQSCDGLTGGSYNNGDAGFVVGAGVARGGVGISHRWTRSLVPVAPFGSNLGFLAGAKGSSLALSLELISRLH